MPPLPFYLYILMPNLRKMLSLLKTKGNSLASLSIIKKLKFEGKIRKIYRKVSQQVDVLNYLKKILPFELRLGIYGAFIAPHFHYCSES